MVKLKIGSNLDRREIIVSGDNTPKAILEEEGIILGTGTPMLDGSPLNATEMNTPLATLINGAEQATLLMVVKTNNA